MFKRFLPLLLVLGLFFDGTTVARAAVISEVTTFWGGTDPFRYRIGYATEADNQIYLELFNETMTPTTDVSLASGPTFDAAVELATNGIADYSINQVFDANDPGVPPFVFGLPGEDLTVLNNVLFADLGQVDAEGYMISDFRLFTNDWEPDDIVGFITFQVNGERISPVPVPAALPLFLTALTALGLLVWRRRPTAH